MRKAWAVFRLAKWLTIVTNDDETLAMKSAAIRYGERSVTIRR